jgi:carbon-monoxide dehydrogenase medium subunit
MYPESVESIRAESLSEAARLLREHGPRARLLAGGQSLIPLLKFRLAVPDVLVDISHLSPDESVRFEDDSVHLHALTTHREAGEHERLTETFDVVGDAIPQLADPQVRNMGTVGGSLAEADPAGDWGPLVLVADGVVHVANADGERTTPASEFFVGPFETALEPDEVVTGVSLDRPTAAKSGGAYLKVKRRQGVYAVAGVGVRVGLNEGDECVSISVACNAVEPTYATPDVTDVFLGERIDDESVTAGADRIESELDPVADTHGSADYKRNLCTRLFERAARAARDRALGHAVDPDPMGVAP